MADAPARGHTADCLHRTRRGSPSPRFVGSRAARSMRVTSFSRPPLSRGGSTIGAAPATHEPAALPQPHSCEEGSIPVPRNRTPMAWAAPAPQSLVALPPIPMRMRRAPASRAAVMSWPVPYVLVSSGLRFAGGTSASPVAAAISMTAVRSSPPSMPHAAWTSSPSGPATDATCRVPSVAATNASTVPSPPSAMGTTSISASGTTRRTPRAIAAQTSAAGRASLNLSGAMTIRMRNVETKTESRNAESRNRNAEPRCARLLLSPLY